MEGFNLNRRLLSFTTYLGYFFIGIVSFIISPTLPVIIKDFGISVGIAGSIFTASALGGFVGAILGGFLSDLLGRKPLIIVGCILQFVGFAATALTQNWFLILMFFLMNSLGRGFISICFNALISDINPDRRGAAFNTLHGIYGIGNLIGPMITGFILSRSYDWRVVYYGAAALWLGFMLITIPIKYPSTDYVRDNTSRESKEKLFPKSLIVNPILIILFMVSFIYNGSATGLVGWINTHLDWMDFSILLGAGMVSIFYIGLTLGRFICRFVSEQIGYSKIILLCALGSLIFYPFAIYSRSPFLITVGVFGSGLFLSGLHPTGLAYANSLFPTMSGTVTALLSTAMSLGAMSLPWLIGVVAESRNFRVGFSIGYISIAILVVISIILIKYEKRFKN